MKKLKILYVPYAGGTALLCKPWKFLLEPQFEVQPLELAGRGSRFREPFYFNMEEAVEDLMQSIQPYVEEPYVIYGHSFGALLTYELYYKILEAKLREPEHLFFSGCIPPNKRETEKKVYDLDEASFIREVMNYHGMEQEILENKELMEIIMPILRADFQVLDQYRYREKAQKINRNVTVLYGNDMTYNQVQYWADLMGKRVVFHHIDGDHFFIKTNVEEVLKVVQKECSPIVTSI